MKIRIHLVALCAIVCAGGIHAQSSDYFRQNITGAFVYGVTAGPNGGVSYPFLNDSLGFSIDYSYRPLGWLAIEAGYDQIVRPVGSSICCEYAKNADDELFLIPFGGRYVWEPASGRLRLTLGGGGAYMNHSVGNQAGGTVGFYGWGGQFVASGDYAITRSGRLRAGLTARYYFASPKPTVYFGPPGFHPSDTLHLFVIGPSVTFSFQ